MKILWQIYSKDKKENLLQRFKFISDAKDDLELQELLKIQCKNDPLFFFNIFLWTYKPKAVWNEWEPTDNNLPFITYPFQDDFILQIVECIEKWLDNSTEKSREMWFSWQILWIWLWGFLFKWWSWLIWSYKQDYVDTQWNMDSSFERLRYMIDKLPKWMIPNDLISKYMSISSKTLWAEMAWDSWDNFGTGWRRKWIFMDEFALWRTDETAFRKTKDVTNCRIIWWTPEWKFNVYGKIMTNHPDYEHLEIKKIRLHWRLHPLKDQEWYETQKRQRTKLDVAKELDISYDDSVTWAVYPFFNDMVKIWKYEYNPDLKTYTSWDFGRDANVVIVWQKDFKFNKLYIIKSFEKINRDIQKFASFITWKPTNWYTYTAEELKEIEYMSNITNYSWHFWDPYNWSARQTNASQSIKEILDDMWIYLHLKHWTTIESRITDTILSLNRISIDEQNVNLIESMIQSRYPKTKEWSETTREKTKPIHDWNSHYRTAFEYFIDNEPKSITKKKKHKAIVTNISYIN